MFETKVTQNVEKKAHNPYVSNVMETGDLIKSEPKTVNYSIIIDRIVFSGLTIGALAAFYFVISSLML